MVVGFNHNVMYKGEVFHVQTEDSGVANPTIVTLLYRGGTIIASRKTSYADIVRVSDLDRVVENLMKEQHKNMLRRLKNGEFDARAFPAATQPAAGKAATPLPAAAPSPQTPPSPPKSPDKPASLDEVILDFLMGGDK